MKFLKILKEYNQAIIKENQKLKSIYETLLKESDGEDVKLATECDLSEDTETTNEDDLLSGPEFFAEGGETDDEGTENVAEGVKAGAAGAAIGAIAGGPVGAAIGGALGAACEEREEDSGENAGELTTEMMSAAEFFEEADAETDTNTDTDTETANECDVTEAAVEPKMDPEDFFDIHEGDDDENTVTETSTDKVEETEEAQRAAEFFAEADKKCPECGKEPCECPSDELKEAEADKTTGELAEVEEKSEVKPEDDAALEESLKEYRKNNAHLFNG